MAKITLDTITSAYASTSLFQSNFSAIATELNDKVLYRVNPTGEANQMMNDLDMNSNDILNVGNIDTATIRVGGAYMTPNVNSETLTYIDTEFTNVAAQDTFTVDYTVGFVDAYVNGVLLANDDYTATDGTNVVLATPVTLASDVVTIRAFSSFSAGDGITQTTADARYLQGANNLSEITNKETSRNNIGIYSGNKNLIINGDFSVWQRGSGAFSGSEYTADRWFSGLSGATSTVTRGSHTLGQTDVPGNPKYYLSFDTTTGADFAKVLQRVEGVETTAARECTVSFWAKGVNPAGGSFGIRTVQDFGTGGSPSTTVSTILNEDLVLTTSWQKFTATFTPASVSGKTLGTANNDKFEVQIGQMTDTGVAAWHIDISNVQLEFGDTATDFEYVTPADQLARCQRYYETSYNNGAALGSAVTSGGCLSTIYGNPAGTNIQATGLTWKVRKRATPAVTLYSPSGSAPDFVYTTAASGNVAAGISLPDESGFIPYVAASIAVGHGVWYHYTANAEL